MKKPLHPFLAGSARQRLSLSLNAVAVALVFAIAGVASNAEPAGEAKKQRSGLHKQLSVEPSSASLAGGKAQLILSALVRKPGAYVGDYELKVTPYFFKSEKGKLSLGVSDQALQQLAKKCPAEFAGNATTAGSGTTRLTRVKAIPSSEDRGILNISVATEHGPMVFSAPYRFDE